MYGTQKDDGKTISSRNGVFTDRRHAEGAEVRALYRTVGTAHEIVNYNPIGKETMIYHANTLQRCASVFGRSSHTIIIDISLDIII